MASSHPPLSSAEMTPTEPQPSSSSTAAPPPSTSKATTPQDARPPPRPYATLFRLGLQPLIVHFHSHGNGYMDPATLEQFDTKILKRVLRETVTNPELREQLAFDSNVWRDLRDLFQAGVACLSGMCCTRAVVPAVPMEGAEDVGEDAVQEEEEIVNSALIVKNWHVLVKDLARLITLASITRNMLTMGPRAQDLAASREIRIEESLFEVLALCVRVTGRGFDSAHANGKDDERKWQGVVNDFKRLLATTLQVLNNLVVQNERRKLMLWVGLFDSPADGDVTGGSLDKRLIDGLRDDPVVNGSWASSDGYAPGEVAKDGVPKVIRRFQDGLLAHMHRLEDRSFVRKEYARMQQFDKENVGSSPFLLYIGKVGMEIKRELSDKGLPAGATEIAAECKRRWQAMGRDEQKSWHEYYSQLLTSYRDEVVARHPNTEAVEQALKASGVMDAMRASLTDLSQSVEQVQGDLRALQLKEGAAKQNDSQMDMNLLGPDSHENAHLRFARTSGGEAAATASDYRVTYSAKHGYQILQQGKDDLMRRLEPDRQRASRSRRARTRSPPSLPATGAEPAPPRSESQPVPDPPDAPLCLASEDEREPLSDEEDSEYDDPVPGDDGRGLLTDVPLILGPTEIEVLPMIVQSGIVPPAEGQPGYGESKEENDALKSMHTLRCHLLLAQDTGRNLVRELLIFVAAWDLREEELYFQLMTQIIEAILVNGLLPFSYHAFRESKDIISPAQAVIMKLLTHIFRRRQADTAKRGLAIFPRSNSGVSQSHATAPTGAAPYPHRVDVHMVSFLLTEFRRHIIPQTCALIFLQGQIRNGLVSPDEFPLNLWDMERMYEGIYQYLEFFAILTEHERWKGMMCEWEITTELVTLLEELDRAIPRATARTGGKGEYWSQRRAARSPQRFAEEYGYEPQAAGAEYPPPPPPPTTGTPAAAAALSVERPYDPHTVPPVQDAGAPPIPPPPPALEDEPADFEWRNLKKLAVLVLSSLVWKSRKVQDQLGAPGPADEGGEASLKGRGIRALLNCCKVDDYNPYIREHAIMALRFALEGNEENQAVVRGLEKIGVDAAEAGATRDGLAQGQAQNQGQGQQPLALSPAQAAAGAGLRTLANSAAPPEMGINAGQRTTITTATGVKVEVPREVLDLNGYETFVDERGQVHLKQKKEGAGSSATSASRGGTVGSEVFEGDDGLEDGDFM